MHHCTTKFIVDESARCVHLNHTFADMVIIVQFFLLLWWSAKLSIQSLKVFEKSLNLVFKIVRELCTVASRIL